MQGMQEIGLFWVNIKLKVQTRNHGGVKSVKSFKIELMTVGGVFVVCLQVMLEPPPPHGLRATLCNLD